MRDFSMFLRQWVNQDLRKRIAKAKNTNPLSMEELEQREVPAAMWAFDFGATTAPVATGFVGVSTATYNPDVHYGWQSLADSTGKSLNTAGATIGNVVSGTDGTFRADVANGTYDVVATIGDAAALRDRVSIWSEGQLIAYNKTTSAGRPIQIRGRVTVTDGQLNFHIKDNGGVSPTFTIDKLTITPVNWRATGLFDPSAAPSNFSPEANPVELGVEFHPVTDGVITGIRFYKGTANTGPHTGSLWTSTGKLLATANFSNETASGWQEVTFSEPIRVSANASYVASYHTNGHYSEDIDYFALSGVSNGSLIAPSTGLAGGNGVFRFGPSAFPNQSYAGSNYWVDVAFTNKMNSDPPTANAGAAASGDEGSTVNFKGSATGVGPLKYFWNFGDGTTASGTLTPSHKYADDRQYTVTLTVTDAFGRIARATTTANIDGVAPTATLSNNGPVIAGNTVTIKFTDAVDPSRADTAAWMRYSFDLDNDGKFEITNSIYPYAYKTFTEPGDYVVAARVADVDGLYTDYTTTVTVGDAATGSGGTGASGPLAANAGADKSVSEGTVVKFGGAASGTGTLTYQWNFGDGGTASGTLTPSHTFADNGTYTVTLTVTDSSGASVQDTLKITVANAKPTATLTNNGPININNPVTITFSNQKDASADLAAGFKYSYDFDNNGTFEVSNSSTATASTTFATTGSHIVKGRITDKDGAFTDYTTTVSVVNTTAGTYQGLTIPKAHARLWFTPERLTQARAYYATHPFTPKADDPMGNATRYLMTGETQYAQNAINSLMAFTISDSELAGVASDNYRWADWVPLVFDWCYDQMTPTQRSTFIDRYNYYTDTMIAKGFGGPSMPGNNYFWGVWRNELNWAIASYYENTAEAQKFLDDALTTRWNSFLAYASGPGAGGVTQEGSGYGQVMLQYPTGPLVTSALDGRNLLDETNFYTEAAYALIYSTSPGPVANVTNGSSYYQLFTFNDDESGGFVNANSHYLADYMTAMAGQYAGTQLGGYISQWLANVGGQNAAYFVRATANIGPASPLGDLPTDYYAAGPQYLYAKSDWSTDAMSLNFQLGVPTAVGHLHRDSGTFQIMRGGQWITKESTGYATTVVGFDGVGTAAVSSTLAHNGVLVNGLGQATSWAIGPPVVTRLESRQHYTFASVDLTQAYRSNKAASLDNPAVGSVVRDFIYVRDLDALITFDRMASTSASDSKTFLLHFPNAPTISGNTVLGVNGDQALKLTTLVPEGQSAPTMKVINEVTATPDWSTDYQYRLEQTSTGQAQSYMINVLQARDVTGADLQISMTENSTGFTITLKDPATGKTAVVNLAKGMDSTGGSFGYSPSGTPTQTALINSVQIVQATENGVVWS